MGKTKVSKQNIADTLRKHSDLTGLVRHIMVCETTLDSEDEHVAELKAEISTLQAENAELAKLLTEGCNGFGSVLIQTSDMDGVNDWRKRVKEYLLTTKHRSK